MEDEDVPNWREVLKAQQDDLKFLSQNAVDDDLDADIDKVLSRPVAPSSWIMKPKVSSTMNDLYEDNDGAADNKRQLSSLPAADVLRGTSSPPRPGSGVKTGEPPKENLSHIEPSHDTDPLNAGESVATPKAPDAGARFQKAKIKMLTKQLEDAQSSRKLVTDQMENLKQQLKNDREENKQLKKRIQILEIENKRASSRKQNETTVGDKAESLLQVHN